MKECIGEAEGQSYKCETEGGGLEIDLPGQS